MGNHQLGARIMSFMAEKGWKSSQLSEKTGIDRGLAYRILHDQANPNYSTITKICEGLKINADWLIFGNEPRERLRPEMQKLMSYMGGVKEDSQFLGRILSRAYYTYQEEEEATTLLRSLDQQYAQTEHDSYSIFKSMYPYLLLMFEERHLKNVLIFSRLDDDFYVEHDKNGNVSIKHTKVNVDIKTVENEKAELQAEINKFVMLQSDKAKDLIDTFLQTNKTSQS